MTVLLFRRQVAEPVAETVALCAVCQVCGEFITRDIQRYAEWVHFDLDGAVGCPK